MTVSHLKTLQRQQIHGMSVTRKLHFFRLALWLRQLREEKDKTRGRRSCATMLSLCAPCVLCPELRFGDNHLSSCVMNRLCSVCDLNNWRCIPLELVTEQGNCTVSCEAHLNVSHLTPAGPGVMPKSAKPHLHPKGIYKWEVKIPVSKIVMTRLQRVIRPPARGGPSGEIIKLLSLLLLILIKKYPD